MKKAALQPDTLSRQLLLADLIQKELKKKPGATSIQLNFSFFKPFSISDLDGIERALKHLKQALGNDFDFSLLTHGKAQSVLDTNPNNLPQVPYAYKVILENRPALAAHIAALKEKTKSIKNQFSFYLVDVSPNESELRLVGSSKKAPKMRKNLRRYKILNYLAKKKGKVTTSELADEFGISETDVRDTITAIKDVVQKTYKIPRSAIFENDLSGKGYSASNIELK